MMSDIELLEFINSELYLSYLNELEQYMPEKIDRDTKIHHVVIAHLNKCFRHSAVTFEDLKWLMTHERMDSITYIVKHFVFFREPDGGEDQLVNLPPQIYYPIFHLIDYYLLLKRKEDLLGYIKAIRIPGAAKHKKDITKLFLEAKSRDSL